MKNLNDEPVQENYKDTVEFLDACRDFPSPATASACKTHEEVLAFLVKMEEHSKKDSFSYYLEQKASFGERLKRPNLKTVSRLSSLEDQISFVRSKIFEKRVKNPCFESMLYEDVKKFIDSFDVELEKAQVRVTFWGSRKISIPDRGEYNLAAIAWMANILSSQCSRLQLYRRVDGLNCNYAIKIQNRIHVLYHKSDDKIRESNLWTKIFVLCREFFEGIIFYNPRHWINIDQNCHGDCNYEGDRWQSFKHPELSENNNL